MGTPSFSNPWKTFTAKRDSGSLEVLPEYRDSSVVGFASTQQDIQRLNEINTNNTDRVLYMQHGSDPVVWWNPDLMLHRPDWLNESRAADVMNNFNWFPMLTFIQVTVDQFVGTNAPNGYGHNYGNTIVEAWVHVSHPDTWTNQKTKDLSLIVR